MIPTCHSLFLCDHAYTKTADGRTYLLGIFDAVTAGSLPYRRELAIHYQVHGLLGGVTFEVRFTREATGQVIGALVSPAYVVHRPTVVVVQSATVDVTFPAHGRYRVGLHVNGRELTRRPLDVLAADEPVHYRTVSE